MVLGWFDTRAVVAFAAETAREIQAAFPPTEESRRVRPDKRAKRIERAINKARAFGKEHKLNFYKRAQFANTLRWALKEAGYPEEFVRDVVGLVVVSL
jgi:hypothetical protein